MTPLLEKVQVCRRNWTQRVNRISHNRFPKKIKVQTKRQKDLRENIKESSRRVRPGRVNGWPTA